MFTETGAFAQRVNKSKVLIDFDTVIYLSKKPWLLMKSDDFSNGQSLKGS